MMQCKYHTTSPCTDTLFYVIRAAFCPLVPAAAADGPACFARRQGITLQASTVHPASIGPPLRYRRSKSVCQCPQLPQRLHGETKPRAHGNLAGKRYQTLPTYRRYATAHIPPALSFTTRQARGDTGLNFLTVIAFAGTQTGLWRKSRARAQRTNKGVQLAGTGSDAAIPPMSMQESNRYVPPN